MGADQRVAIQALLERSGRRFVPIRRALLQTREGRKRGGPTSQLGKREAALDLYLLLHALASREPWDVTLPARVWARLLGASENASGTTLISRQWSWLEEQRLVRTSRAGRARRIVLLREDGSGRPYTHPGVMIGDSPAEGDYFRLPHAYWRGGWDARLPLAAKLVLLIACSLRDPFILPVEHAAQWYGTSANRIHRGLSELRAVGLLDMSVTSRPAPLTERGVTFERHYTLRPPLRTPTWPMTFNADQIGAASTVSGTADCYVRITLPDGSIGHLLCGPGRFNSTELPFKQNVAAALTAHVEALGSDSVLEALKRGDLRLDQLVTSTEITPSDSPTVFRTDR